MFQILKGIVSNDLYLQLWANRLKIYAIRSQEVFDEEPLMALKNTEKGQPCLLYTSPSPRDLSTSRMPSSA